MESFARADLHKRVTELAVLRMGIRGVKVISKLAYLGSRASSACEDIDAACAVKSSGHRSPVAEGLNNTFRCRLCLTHFSYTVT
jgi:hypothetical protein